MRSFGVSPLEMNELMVLFRPASSDAIWSTSPSGPVMAAYWPIAVSLAITICARTDWIESVRAPACWTSACLAARSSGALERSDHDFQNFTSWALMPLSPGSESESSALSSASARACQSLRFVLWLRNWVSRNWSRTRRKPSTSTPEPRCAPLDVAEPETCSCIACEAASVASWRE